MKRILILLCIAALVLPCLCACTGGGDGRISVVCTSFAPYDLLTRITGGREGVSVKLLSESGADPHSFQPTAEHFAAVYSADLFVYIGQGSEPWAADAASLAAEQGVKTLSLFESAGVRSHGHEGHDHGEDEHVWLSPAIALTLSESLCDAMCAVDPDGEQTYKEGLAALTADLDTLASDYAAMRAGAVRDTVIVADRYPFTYLFEEYGITAHAAFPGCSAESEASFETVATLAQCLADLDLPAVLVTETSDGALARTVCESAGVQVQVLTLHSLQSLTPEEREGGRDYIYYMRENLEVLRKALY